MIRLTQSDIYRTLMYLIFTLGVFFAVGVRLSHGGVFGEVIVPSAAKFGELLIFLSFMMWGVKKIMERQN